MRLQNEYLVELLEELNEMKFEYTITNGWFEITLGNAHYQFHIKDEEETLKMMDILWHW